MIIYSEKATKFSNAVTVKSTVEISQIFVAFSEYMNFMVIIMAVEVDGSTFCAELIYCFAKTLDKICAKINAISTQ